jgi:hypothetical protein
VSYIRTSPTGVPTRCDRRLDRLALAGERFRDFHARAPPRIVRATCRRTVPPVLVQLGRLRALVYTADRGDGGRRSYIHFMEREPLLTCDPNGTQLYIVGGSYRITRRGIEG